MIVSKPKFNTLFALGVFLILPFGSFFFLMNSLISNPQDYFYIKLILTPLVLVIGLLVFGKFLGSLKNIRFGNKSIEIKYLLSRTTKNIPLDAVLGWKEEAVKTKSGAFKETKILYGKKRVLKLSNKENTEYERVVKFLTQKLKKKMAKK